MNVYLCIQMYGFYTQYESESESKTLKQGYWNSMISPIYVTQVICQQTYMLTIEPLYLPDQGKFQWTEI